MRAASMRRPQRRFTDGCADEASALHLAGAADVGCQAGTLQQHDRVPAEVDLPRGPAEACGPGLRVVIAVPVLALKKMERGEPDDVLRRVFAGLPARAHVRDAVDEALR